MSRFGYSGPSEYEPLGAWNYFGLTILYSIPLLGFIFLIVHALSGSNVNRRSFARSYFCGLILVLVIIGISFIAGIAGAGISGIVDKIKNIIGSI